MSGDDAEVVRLGGQLEHLPVSEADGVEDVRFVDAEHDGSCPFRETGIRVLACRVNFSSLW